MAKYKDGEIRRFSASLAERLLKIINILVRAIKVWLYDIRRKLQDA